MPEDQRADSGCHRVRRQLRSIHAAYHRAGGQEPLQFFWKMKGRQSAVKSGDHRPCQTCIDCIATEIRMRVERGSWCLVEVSWRSTMGIGSLKMVAVLLLFCSLWSPQIIDDIRSIYARPTTFPLCPRHGMRAKAGGLRIIPTLWTAATTSDSRKIPPDQCGVGSSHSCGCIDPF